MTQSSVDESAESESDEREEAEGHLDDLDGAMGCTEIWEKMSEQRDE